MKTKPNTDHIVILDVLGKIFVDAEIWIVRGQVKKIMLHAN